MHEPLLRVNIIDARDGLKTDIGKSDFFFPLPENILSLEYFSPPNLLVEFTEK